MQLKFPQQLPLGKAHPGILHQYTSNLVAFEYTHVDAPKPHTLIFIGGLSDGLHTVDYLSDIVTALHHTSWSVFNVVLSSSYTGWGMGRVGKDIDEIAKCVAYVRQYKREVYGSSLGGTGGPEGEKVVIMGHSTGSQDVMSYLCETNPRPRHAVLDRDAEYEVVTRGTVDGAIMQAPVSDREAILSVVESGTERESPESMGVLLTDAVGEAERKTYDYYHYSSGDGRGSTSTSTSTDGEVLVTDTLVPLQVTARIGYGASTAVTSRRFLSLASPRSPEHPAEDDLFSSDLSDKQLRRTFGVLGTRGLLGPGGRLLVLYSGRDQSVPAYVDKEALMGRWKTAAGESWDSGSLVIPGASHALSDDDQKEPRRVLVERVMGYLDGVEISHTSSEFAPDIIRACTPHRLKELKRFSRLGGPDTSDLRDHFKPSEGFSYFPTLSQTQDSEPSLAKMKKTGGVTASCLNFEQHLIEHEVFLAGCRRLDGRRLDPPQDLAIIRQQLSQRRTSLSESNFSANDFQDFTDADLQARKEHHVKASIVPIIEGSQSDSSCTDGDRYPFTNLSPLTDGLLVPATPDDFSSAPPDRLDARIRSDLEGQIVPSAETYLPIAPNFFLEVKCSDGSSAVLRRQACYYGALEARTIHALQTFGQGPPEPAYEMPLAITVAYTSGTLLLYAHSLVVPENADDGPLYVMTQLGGWCLMGDLKSLRQGLMAYRNARN
ncbi:non-cytosolic esterase/lipase [Aspergillus affinis]|uniref:non-cytosolic esterase/lipase n=1 Tax=Aspergillus affinis TaxID=1070780 RepID=UPI0022FEEB19|nr:non-cytosolic esterase/lipase [Aspergillus affinis]KAI9039963.1 non-cytosolic esterase/lipase [Aspergillus affinis]